MALRHCAPNQQQLPDGSSLQRPCQQQLCHGVPCQQQLRHGALASNKPHPAEKSTAVWLAIWRTWAGFANSQLRRTTLHSTYSYIYPSPLLPPWNRCSDRRKSFGPSAPIAYATSVSTPNEAIAWLGRRCLVLDEAVASQGRRCWMANAADGCPWRSSCKSPRARILVLGTSGAHWLARWPRFEFTERVAES